MAFKGMGAYWPECEEEHFEIAQFNRHTEEWEPRPEFRTCQALSECIDYSYEKLKWLGEWANDL